MEPIAPNAVLHHPESGFLGRVESAASGVSWGAVAGGAFVAAAMALILLAFGAGLGLTSVSPWSHLGASAKAVSVATVIWLVVMQLVSSAMGGYVAGRLRTKWVDVRDEEVFFRDTAHGFLVWAVGLVIAAGFLGSAASSLVGAAMEATGGAAATATVATAAGAGTAIGTGAATGNGNAAGARGAADPTAYFVDALFRSERPMEAAQAPSSPTPGAGSPVGGGGTAGGSAPAGAGTDNSGGTAWATQGGAPRGADAGTRIEAGRILANGLLQNEFPAADRAYLVQLVASRTGMSATEADRRVSTVLANAQQAKMKALETADEARKTAAQLAFWTFFAMLAGAFAASYAATIGGRQRDEAVLRTAPRV